MIQEYSSSNDYTTILETSKNKPIFLLKHSTACPVSSSAHRQFVAFADGNNEADFWIVLVREQRPLSLEIAEKSGISHQSPQILLFSQGKPVWDCSHGRITEANLSSALNEL
ncbi:MAG: bacillithiol system redox-active protein YtxJ [Candidatus Zixiibacteriota bacterium]